MNRYFYIYFFFNYNLCSITTSPHGIKIISNRETQITKWNFKNNSDKRTFKKVLLIEIINIQIVILF